MSVLRTLIVDDEPIARKVLREELEAIDAIEVVGEAENGAGALDQIQAKQPDLVFLDIQMPVMDGFEMLGRLTHGHMPVIVMVTAYDQHAIQAFEAGAVDYLLKPVAQARLQQAVRRALQVRRNPTAAAEKIADLQEMPTPGVSAPDGPRQRKIVGKVGAEYFLLNAEDILAFQAERDIVWIMAAKKRYQATQPLKNLEERLRNTAFRRIHRNALVNLNHVQKMSMITSQRWLITLTNGQEFTVSKRQAKGVREMLHW